MGLGGREEGNPALYISKVKPGEPRRSKASASIFGSKHTSSSPPSNSSMSQGPSSCLPQGVRKFTGAGTHSQGPAPSPFRSSSQFFRSKFRLLSQRLISQTLNLSVTSKALGVPGLPTRQPRSPASPLRSSRGSPLTNMITPQALRTMPQAASLGPQHRSDAMEERGRDR